MKKVAVIVILLALLIVFSACSQSAGALTGVYVAVGLPSAEETLVERITFEGEQLIMAGGRSQQKVPYMIDNNVLTINTSFGSFSYDFQLIDNGLILDGVTYAKQGE